MKKGILRISILGLLLIGFWFLIFPLFTTKILPLYIIKKDQLVVMGVFDFTPHTIGEFSFVNQEGKLIAQNDYKDKIYVADFFFTTCPNICVPMSNHMKLLQDTFKNESEVRLLSHTVDAKTDTQDVLKSYAENKGAIAGKWDLVTGNQIEINTMAIQQYFATDGDIGIEDFVHTEQFVLVDYNGVIRGRYDGTKLEVVKQLVKDIQILLEEKNKNK